MKADDVMSLPAEVQFSVSKATDMILTVSKVYVTLYSRYKRPSTVYWRFWFSLLVSTVLFCVQTGGVGSAELPVLSAALVQLSSDPSALPADQDPDQQ